MGVGVGVSFICIFSGNIEILLLYCRRILLIHRDEIRDGHTRNRIGSYVKECDQVSMFSSMISENNRTEKVSASMTTISK